MRLLLCVLCAAACSTTPGITITATPNPLPGDGQTPATVVATVTQGGTPSQGVSVHFVATSGAFKEAQQGAPLIADVQTDDQGTAKATLIPSHVGWGSVTFTASASIGGTQPSVSTTINYAPNGGLASTLSFNCARQNIGALVTGRLDPIHVLCTATAKDSSNHTIVNASVQTLAEAGSIDWTTDDSGNQELVYTAAPDDPPPADVDPLGASGAPQEACNCDVTRLYDASACPGEPCWIDPTGPTHNPRDGVATIIAAVPAVQSVDNLGEPFVDTNDNGVHDPGEPYIDFNGNGKYDAADGKVKDRLIWTAFRMIWSGEADRSTSAHASNIAVTKDGTNFDVHITLHDRNFNALAADGLSGADGIALSSTCTNGGTINDLPSPGIKMPQEGDVNDGYPGILFKSDPGQPDNGAIANPGSHTTWLGATTYDFTVSYATGGNGNDTCAIDGLVNRTYDPGAPGFDIGSSANINTELIEGKFAAP